MIKFNLFILDQIRVAPISRSEINVNVDVNNNYRVEYGPYPLNRVARNPWMSSEPIEIIDTEND